MIGAFVMLFVGAALLGGAYSFFRSRKPWWSVLALAAVGLILMGLSYWTIRSL